MKIEGKITKEEYERILQYAQRSKLNSVTNFFIANKNAIKAGLIPLSNLLTANKLIESNCYCFLRAIRSLQQGKIIPKTYYYHDDENYDKELRLFNTKKLIQETEVDELISNENLHQLLKTYFNFKYIKTMMDNIAKKNGYILVTRNELQKMPFTVTELDQLIVGLLEADGVITHYEPMRLDHWYAGGENYAYYYVKNQGEK